VTANNDADKALLKRFKLFGPPGIIFFDAAGAERTGLRVVGFQDAEAFGKVLDAALARRSRIRKNRYNPRLNRGALQGTGATRRPRLDVSAGKTRRATQPRSPVHALFANPCRARGDAVSHILSHAQSFPATRSRKSHEHCG
jgi:hypothetical protein